MFNPIEKFKVATLHLNKITDVDGGHYPKFPSVTDMTWRQKVIFFWVAQVKMGHQMVNECDRRPCLSSHP